MRNPISLSFSPKKNDSVATPSYLYNLLNEEFGFDFDPCPINPSFDGLAVDWGQNTYVNPPYSSIGRWVKKGISWARGGEDRRVVFLIPYRGSTKYWRDLVFPFSSEIRFLTRQIVFTGYNKSLPIPLVVVVFTSSSTQKPLREEKLIVTKEIIKKRTLAKVSYFTLS